MRPLLEEFTVSLNEVERAWLRRPVVMLLFIPILFFGILKASYDLGEMWFGECW